MSEIFISTSVLEDGLPGDVAVNRLIEQGYDRIEIGSTHIFDGDYMQKIADLKDRAALIIHNYFPPAEKGFVLNLASADNAIRSASVAQVMRSIDFCYSLSLDLYSFHAGFIGDLLMRAPDTKTRNFDFEFIDSGRVGRSRAFELFMDSLKALCDHAARYDMKIACENSGSISKNEFLLMRSADEFQEMFSIVDYPHLGVLLDMGHLKLSSRANGFHPEEFVAVVQPRVFEVHLHENDGRNDQHSSLYPDCEVINMLNKSNFAAAVITLEGRMLTPYETEMSYRILRKSFNADFYSGHFASSQC